MAAFNLNNLTSNYIRPCQILFSVTKLVEDYDTKRKIGSFSLSDEVNALSLAINQTEATERNRKILDLCKEIISYYALLNVDSGKYVEIEFRENLGLLCLNLLGFFINTIAQFVNEARNYRLSINSFEEASSYLFNQIVNHSLSEEEATKLLLKLKKSAYSEKVSSRAEMVQPLKYFASIKSLSLEKYNSINDPRIFKWIYSTNNQFSEEAWKGEKLIFFEENIVSNDVMMMGQQFTHGDEEARQNELMLQKLLAGENIDTQEAPRPAPTLSVPIL
jgi:hypothetical protein